MHLKYVGLALLMINLISAVNSAWAKENWLQYQYDAGHSGNAQDRSLATPLECIGALPLSDAVFTAPVIAEGRIYVVDGSGVAFCIDAQTLRPVWKFVSDPDQANCNNVSSPLVIGNYLHFGTMTGTYYILNIADGSVVNKITCGEPIFSTPVAGADRVYFATLGSRVYALKPDGSPVWLWDFVREILSFPGDRWSGLEWCEHSGRATWENQFCCSRDLALFGKTLVVPAGGTIVWLEDMGSRAELRGKFLGGPRESPATLGLSIGEQGEVYRQWTRRDNEGRVEILRLRDGKVEPNYVAGTETNYNLAGLLSFSSVSIRGQDVYRCRPEENYGFCRHRPDQPPRYLGGYPSISPPILLKDSAVYGGLDGRLYVAPLREDGQIWSFETSFGKAISAPAAVSDGRIYFGCEDGYLYILGPGRNQLGPGRNQLGADRNQLAVLAQKDLELWKIRSRLSGRFKDDQYNWFTNFGNFSNTNQNEQDVGPPFKLKWIRRYEGTVKHFSVCGGGRMYTHTAEGQIFALEQETGRMLWRRYFPGVHVSYTAPVYYEERLYVPQFGLERSRLRCLDAATGNLLWEAPLTGSPSWNRQLPPIIHKNLVIYLFSTGKYTASNWLFEHQATFGFPADHKPLVRAWNKDTAQETWTQDFSPYGSGGDDAGMCLMDNRLYYSCYFGKNEPQGVTAALDPESGKILWLTTKYAVHAGCTVSGKDGRLYLGGYNPVDGETNYIWCLDARDGSLIWKSDPVQGAIHVITIGKDYLFTHVQYQQGYLIDKENGKILYELTKGYRCTRFTLSEPYLLGANLNIHDLRQKGELVYAGPALDVMQCVGGFVSNGRIFYTTNGGGLQASLLYGAVLDTGNR